ncbi:MAG: TRAP transporter large permease [Eubacteriales bacterium]|nr:TRAP transporter large permease [Eubacteriales bacterium]MDD4104848.1 TRAP transporter large permease [Eubacteriales bacterium]MDD4710406.1 TRAP transporter large permease [Eubacteriales bacterium]
MTALLVTFLVLLLINAPIAFVIGGAGMAWFIDAGRNLDVLAQYVITQTQSIAFLAVPFFIFAGNLMNRTGITRNLINFSRLLTRRMVGGIAQVSVLLSTLMGGVSGSAVADASMEARILGPEMIKRGYPGGYAAGVICLTSLITATIPPSLGLILYGFVGGVSIGKLFVAGIIPGIMMMAVLMTTVHFTSKRRGFDLPAPDAKRPTWKEIWAALKTSIWALIFPIILIVGIRFGLFTPTEAGAFAVVYALLVGKFVYKELTWKGFLAALKDSFIDNGGIILIIAMSGIFGRALTILDAPGFFTGFLFSLTSNPQILMVLLMLLLVVLGMFIDSNVNILLLTPIVLPILSKMGVDPVHFGICMMTIVTMGCMTPPVGTALYTVCDILDVPIEQYFKETIPFYAAIIVLVLVLVFIPGVVMWLPNLLY